MPWPTSGSPFLRLKAGLRTSPGETDSSWLAGVQRLAEVSMEHVMGTIR